MPDSLGFSGVSCERLVAEPARLVMKVEMRGECWQSALSCRLVVGWSRVKAAL